MFNVNDILELPVTKEVIEKTISNTVKKYNHTCKNLMYSRTPVELLDNIYMGDIAKNSIFLYLSEHCKCPVIDYDEIRTDNFEEPDPGWDIMVGTKKIKIEIKSSIPPQKEQKEDIIKLRDIKITASHDNGKTWRDPQYLESDIHIQVYFYATPYRKGFDKFEDLSSVISSDMWKIRDIIKSDKYNSPLFFGYNTKDNIIKYLHSLPENERTWSFSWTTRIYWKCPIKDSYNMSSLINYLNNIEENNSEKNSIEFKGYNNDINNKTTLIPWYSIYAACGDFTGGREVGKLKDIPIENVKGSGKDLFIVEAIGKSMMPLIEEGHLCVFKRTNLAEEGDIVLVEECEYTTKDFGSYIIKKYTRNKNEIKLISLNPKMQDKNVTITEDNEEKYNIRGIFVGTISSKKIKYLRDL